MIRIYLLLVLMGVLSAGSVHAISLRTSAQDGNLMWFNPNDSVMPGFSMELIRLLQQTDTQLHISGQENVRSLRRLETDLANGKIDMAVGMVDSPSRRQHFVVISKPVLYVQHAALAVRKDDYLFRLPEGGVGALGQYGVLAIAQGSAYGEYLHALGALPVDDGAITVAGNLGKLVRHRVRFVLHAQEELGWHIRLLQLQQRVRLIPVAGGQKDVCLMLSRKLPNGTVRRLHSVLLKLERSGSLGALRVKYGLNGMS
ncbi:transporter substrate-binding domain-containing protein [Aquitalea sp. LB_tupeE]|uniref:transporter substrate-binding domain-containing protein n=1 Tax=Aquitalea sp. LB_tupeE TaxID=2748078 RepID=UPI0015B7B322|nr:transporter substrate-binding domain-containing protein [Aquitalea sp. LB_tupeE]NWK78057.1 transporter substrate-binding domain-containing protein [Aquitalea sp. LB_tupeE]